MVEKAAPSQVRLNRGRLAGELAELSWAGIAELSWAGIAGPWWDSHSRAQRCWIQVLLVMLLGKPRPEVRMTWRRHERVRATG